MVFNFYDMRRAAFRTFAAAHTLVLFKLGIGFEKPSGNQGKGLLQKYREGTGKIQPFGIWQLERGQAFRDGIAV